MSSILSRISQLADSEKINITSLERKIGASKGVLSRAINKNTDIQSKWLGLIVENYPLYSAEWILTGRGGMLKKDNETELLNSETIDKVIDLATQLGMQIKENERLHHKNMELTAELEALKKKKSPPVPRVQSTDYGDSIKHIPGIAAEP